MIYKIWSIVIIIIYGLKRIKKMKTISMKQFGTSLVSRITAREIFFDAEKHNFEVIFDLEWVKYISSWFADELFAKMIVAWYKNFKIINIESDYIKDFIVFVTESRKKSLWLQMA